MSAWAQTVQLALFEPGRLYASARLDRSADQLWFAVLTGSVFSIVNQLVQRFLAAQTGDFVRRFAERVGNADHPLVKRMLEQQHLMATPRWLVATVLLTPVVMAVFVYLNAGVTHLFAALFGQSRRGFAATFTACAYGAAPMVLLAVPGCGSFIAVIWMIVLIGIGLKVTHGIRTGGATAAVLAPYVLLCCLCGAASIMMVVAMQKGLGR